MTLPIHSSVSANFFSQPNMEEFKTKVVAPELTREILYDKKKFRGYFKKIRKMITKKIHVRGVKFRVLRWDKYSVPKEEYVIFLPVVISENKFCILLRFTNLYLLGIQTSDSECVIFHENLKYGGWGQDEYENFERCMAHYGLDPLPVFIGEAYSCLQKLSGYTRSDLTLGLNKLIATLGFLSKSNWTDYSQVSLHLLYITQFFCEPLRISVYADWLCDNLLANEGDGFDIPVEYLILQYGWGAASESIARLFYEKKELDVFYADNELGLSVEILSNKYAMLMTYREIDLECETVNKNNKNNMTVKYVSSFPEFEGFGIYYKSSFPMELANAGKDYQVTAIKHIFERNMVFEYNFNHENPEMLKKNFQVIVDYQPEYDEECAGFPVKNISVSCLGQKQIYMAVDKPIGVTYAKFLNTLTFVDQVDSLTENNTAAAKVEIKLQDIYFPGTDYINKFPYNFMEKWEAIGQDCEREDVYVFKPLRSHNNLSNPVNIVNSIFGMHLCEETKVVPEIHPEDASLTIYSLSGLYMRSVTVLVQVTINFIVKDSTDTKAVQMKVTHRCDDHSVYKYIRTAVVNWLKIHCDVGTIEEYSCYFSDQKRPSRELIYGTQV